MTKTKGRRKAKLTRHPIMIETPEGRRPISTEEVQQLVKVADEKLCMTKRDFDNEARTMLRKEGWIEIGHFAKCETAQFSIWLRGNGANAQHLTLVVYDGGWEVFAGFDGAGYDEQMDTFIQAVRQ
jgi:hypothetical protein